MLKNKVNLHFSERNKMKNNKKFVCPNIWDPFSDSEKINKLLDALFKAKKNIGTAVITHKNLDLDLKAVVDVSRSALIKNGLDITQRVVYSYQNNKHFLSTVLAHPSSRQWIELRKLISVDINEIKKFEATVKYLKRLLYVDIIGIEIIDEGIKPIENKAMQISWNDIKLYYECPRCFYNKKRLWVKRPGINSENFSLYNANDEVLKKEFDQCRKKGVSHPIMTKNNINAIPFEHVELEKWQNVVREKDSKKFYDGGIRFYDQNTNMILYGGVDDIWINEQGELIVVDYKATSKDDSKITLESRWSFVIKQQISFYCWLLKKNGYFVHRMGYIIYCNALRERATFNPYEENLSYNHLLNFDTKILTFEVDYNWIEKTIVNMRNCLDKDEIPEPNSTCDYCCKYHFVLNDKEQIFST